MMVSSIPSALFTLRVPARADRLKLIRSVVNDAARLYGCSQSCAHDLLMLWQLVKPARISSAMLIRARTGVASSSSCFALPITSKCCCVIRPLRSIQRPFTRGT
ncbi:MAG: hypothetical protein FD153_892 [Rhodospirillaceae bacterium]|nr:MAG: hypothetical protein FD153_892 [Rhodospirillaceae bacterium]